MLITLMLMLGGCGSGDTTEATSETGETPSETGETPSETGLADTATSPTESALTCSVDEFCEEMIGCFSVIDQETCLDFWDDGTGGCEDATDDVLKEFRQCVCDCWTSDDGRSCFYRGSCSDWCGVTICGVF
jgi:hypothetical protein